MKFGYFLRPGVTYVGMVELAQHGKELSLHGAYQYARDNICEIYRGFWFGYGEPDSF